MDLVNHIDAIAISLGYTLMAAISLSIVAGVVIGVAKLSNRAQHELLRSIGGWKTFLEYRKWFHQNRNGKKPAVEVTKHGDYEVATAPSSNGFTSWAKQGRIEGTNPINEPGLNVWFNFGRTREEAKRKILLELELPVD